MHPAAYEWVARFGTTETVRVLDIGGRNINGSCRSIFPGADYTAVDLYPGQDVDVVADITEWGTDEVFDVVVCAEVLEHATNWKAIVRTAYKRCREGGTFVMTCAGPGRASHSGIDGAGLKDDEYYGNVDPTEFEKELVAIGWTSFMVNVAGCDLRAVAVR